MTTLDDEKRALRAEVRSRMPRGEALVAASAAAQARLLASAMIASARMVGLYRALPSECGTAALAAALGASCCYPVIAPGVRALHFRRSAGVFVSGSLGIEEPTGSAVPLEEIDVLVVPAVAADERCYRLGRGKGHYDATLAGFSGTSVALVLETQLVPRVPVGEHDARLSAVCTETRLILA